jgi:prepilin-type N-terminal cleavage/methylation domain-containing protein
VRIARRAYTLVEVLIVVVILGVAASIAIPSMGDTGVLRVQAGLRAIVADITTAQSEALAYQEGRAVRFYPEEGRWVIIRVQGTTIDESTGRLFEGRLNGIDSGDAAINSADFNGSTTLIFDEMGGPVIAAGSNQPAPTGAIVISGSGQRFRIEVQGYTGRVVVTREATP